MMSYAKNHPVPFVEDDIVAGDRPPRAAWHAQNLHMI